MAALEGAVGPRGLEVPLDEFAARAGGPLKLKRLLGAFTVTERPHAGRPRGMGAARRTAYAIDRGARPALVLPRRAAAALLQPRGAGLAMLDAVRCAEGWPAAARPLTAEACAADAPLYDYQEALVDHLCDGPLAAPPAAGGGVAYLQLDTGLGKTRLGLALVARRAAPALVVVPTQAIADQWIEEAAEAFPGMRAAVFSNAARARPGPATHDLVVVVVNTFRDKEPAFVAGFGTVLLDEAHELHSPCNSRALWLAAAAPAVLGLSATPLERPDGLDRLVCLHLGPPLQPRDVPGFDAGAVRFAGAVRAVEYRGDPAYAETVAGPTGTMSAILTIGRLVADPARLRLVAAEVERLCCAHEAAGAAAAGLGPRPAEAATPRLPAGEVRRHGVLVFAEHRDFLPALREAIAARLGARADVAAPELEPDISLLRGGVAREEVARARLATTRVVVSTYGFSRRGVSLQHMTALVLATPRRHGMRQILGRILRRGSDESIVRQVVDIVDVCTGLRGQAAERRKVYREKGFPVERVAAAWDADGAPAPAGDDDEAEAVSEATTAELFEALAAK